ncbi:unnamed protein product [Gongylonema pulchrum]|uniref:Dynein heavy chain n=1 Tax=Gongylonema pulchrum TaxID=637853 RepID=A0A183DVU1_9BILA|nr:unnamed protein product [Gongylonema pulchrum]
MMRQRTLPKVLNGLEVNEGKPSQNYSSLYVSTIQRYLPTLFNSLRLTDQGLWSEFARTMNCETAFPPAVDTVISPFQKLLVIQAVRPERLFSAMTIFITEILGVHSVNPSPLDLGALYRAESNENEPILIFTSPGADPSQELEELAKKEISGTNFYQISMGQGQLQAAIEAIRSTAASGGWVCLKNLHLVIGDLPSVQKEFFTARRHANFRLWLTSESNESIPPQLLQASLKVTYEAPPGIKNNMKRSYAQWQQTGFAKGSVCLQSLFVLAWLHAVLQERRMFIPQAWSKFYEFNNSDLRVAKKYVEDTTKEGKAAEWQLLRGLMQIVAYGGRIDNDFDVNVLVAYLERYFNPSVIGRNGPEIARGIPVPLADSITDNPALFDLPLNIGTAREMNESSEAIRQMRSMQIASNTDTLFDRDMWNKALNPILSLWKRLNSQTTLHSMKIPQAQYTGDLIMEIISLEYVHAVTLVQKVHKFLGAISRCLRGVQIFTPEISSGAQALIMHQTPEEWQEAWAGPCDPVQYLSVLISKAKSIEELSRTNAGDKILAIPIKLSNVFRPTAILNALRQLTARLFWPSFTAVFRKRNVTMDELKLSTAWSAAFLKNETVAELSGIHIQGALFEGHIVEAQQTSPSITSAPNLCIAWIPADAPDVYERDKSIFVPLYNRPDRSEFIAKVQIPCTKSLEHWKIASVALFLSSQ